MNNQVRLNKYLAEHIGVSRREADELIAAGKVTVNGKTAVLGTKIDETSNICYNNKIIPHATDYLYLAFNKPVGYVCSRRAQGTAPTIYDLLPQKYHQLKTVGRLDKDSSGLILLTNDGDFAYQMTHPKFKKEKIYEVELDKPLAPLHQQMISDFGILLPDGVSKFNIVRDEVVPPLSRESAGYDRGIRRAAPVTTGGGDAGPRKTAVLPRYQVILTEGRNRQIRRTFAALGYEVVKLHRTKLGKFALGTLKSGHYQEIPNPS